jgi:hypothetical protein
VSAANYLDARAWRSIRARFARPAARRSHSPIVPQILYGLALENLLKALLIAQGHPVFDAQGRLGSGYRKHDLLKYTMQAGLSLSATDRTLVARLTRAVTEGKFLVGTQPKARLIEISKTASQSDRQDICRLLETIENELRQRARFMMRRVKLSAL